MLFYTGFPSDKVFLASFEYFHYHILPQLTCIAVRLFCFLYFDSDINCYLCPSPFPMGLILSIHTFYTFVIYFSFIQMSIGCFLQAIIWRFIYCKEWYQDMIDHRIYAHNLAVVKLKPEKISGLNRIRIYDLWVLVVGYNLSLVLLNNSVPVLWVIVRVKCVFFNHSSLKSP